MLYQKRAFLIFSRYRAKKGELWDSELVYRDFIFFSQKYVTHNFLNILKLVTLHTALILMVW